MATPAAKPKPKLSRKKRFLFGFATILLGVFLALVVLEVFLRVTSWETLGLHHLGSLYRYHPRLGRELIPDWDVTVAAAGTPIRYRINARGLRDPDDTPLERTPGVSRIAVLGDSLSFGWGVPEEMMVSEQLERLTEAEALNLGMIAAGTGVQWLLLKEKGLEYQPDIVVLNFFVGNDYRNNLSRRSDWPHFDLTEEGRIAVSNVPVARSIQKRVAELTKRHCLSYFFIGFYAGRARNELKYSDRWYGRAYRSVAGKRKKVGEADLVLLDKFQVETTDEIRRSLAITEAMLRELRDTCDSHGARLLVAVIPDRLQVQDDRWREATLHRGAGEPRLDRHAPSRMCLDICERSKIPTVDLLPDLRRFRDDGIPVFLPNDIHWNEAGHRVAAETIAGRLRDLGWLNRRDH